MSKRAKPHRTAVWVKYLAEGSILVDLRAQRCGAGDVCLVMPESLVDHPGRFALADGPERVETARVIWEIEPAPVVELEVVEWVCEDCGKVYKTPAGYENHVSAKHGGN